MVKVSLFINTLQTWHEPNKALESRPRRAGFDSQRWQNYGVKSPAISTIWLSVSQLSTPGGPTRLLVKGLPAWPHGMGRPATRSPPLLWRPSHGRKATPRTGGRGSRREYLGPPPPLAPVCLLAFSVAVAWYLPNHSTWWTDVSSVTWHHWSHCSLC